MSIIGTQLDRKNPEFNKTDFLFWMPQFTKYVATEEGAIVYQKIYEIANKKIFHSIYGTDWEYAMSLCIAHYMQLKAYQEEAPSGNTLGEIAGGGVTRGLLTSATVGGFSKSYDLQYTAVSSPEAMFWNQTSYGTSLMALLKTKALPSIMVVTSKNIPGA